jgi:DNA-binding ferritin-like protein (Dps family)
MTMSDTENGGFVAKVIGPKRRWRAYKARVRQLPDNYRAAVEAIQRYLMHFVPADGDSAASMFDDLADLFEQAAADATPIREIVGEDPWSSSRRSSRTTRRVATSPPVSGSG